MASGENWVGGKETRLVGKLVLFFTELLITIICLKIKFYVEKILIQPDFQASTTL